MDTETRAPLKAILSPFEIEMLRAGASSLRAQNRTLESVNAELMALLEKRDKSIRRLRWAKRGLIVAALVIAAEIIALAIAFGWAVMR